MKITFKNAVLGTALAATAALGMLAVATPAEARPYGEYRGGGFHGGGVHGGGVHGGGVHGAYRGGAVRGGGYHGGYRGGHNTVVVGGRGAWGRGYRWAPGGAIAAGAAIGFIAAGSAAVYASTRPPAPGLCWYYTDPSRRSGFWDVCP